jgi:hypothetical protein
MKIDYIERIETLDSAAETLREAIDLIEAAVAGTGEERLANSYILPHLRSWLSDSRQSSYCSIADLKSALVQEEPDPEDGIPTEPEPTQDEVMKIVEDETARKEMTEAEGTDYLRKR